MADLRNMQNDGPIDTDLDAQYRDEDTIENGDTYVTDEELTEQVADIPRDEAVDDLLRKQAD